MVNDVIDDMTIDLLMQHHYGADRIHDLYISFESKEDISMEWNGTNQLDTAPYSAAKCRNAIGKKLCGED